MNKIKKLSLVILLIGRINTGVGIHCERYVRLSRRVINSLDDQSTSRVVIHNPEKFVWGLLAFSKFLENED